VKAPAPSDVDMHPSASTSATLAAAAVSVRFEGVRALEDVDLELRRGEILGVIGPNGAGKTTLMNVLTGYQRPTAGCIALDGDDVTGSPPHRLAARGVARTFQGIRLFGKLTVLENVHVAAISAGGSRVEAYRRTWEALHVFGLVDHADRPAAGLAFGEERRVELARAAVMQPRFLLLDEPAAGMNERESARLVETIRRLRRELACGVLVIEHDMPLIMGLCDRVQVLAQGTTLAIGTPSEVRAHAGVREAYLGSHA
jgi:ABC-type branched-subunit amino acid transport system ATPase component